MRTIAATLNTVLPAITFPRLRPAMWFAVMAERRRLANLDASRLADLGISEADAAAEAARPFWDTTARR
ncbi:MAG: hypothetical protein AAF713_10175 [Pseudomonadota bacterium]